MPGRSEISPADAALCARDPALPGLPGVLNAPALAAQAGLGPMRHAYLRYKPGTSCVAGLVPEDGGLGAYAAMTYPAERWAEIRARPKWSSGETPAIFLDEHQCALVPLALERRLRPARLLTSPKHLARCLDAVNLKGCALRILRYKPGRRIVLCAEDPGGLRAVLKFHAGRDAFDHAIAGARHSAALGGPALIGADPDHHAVAVAWIPGQPLDASLSSRDHALAGAMLAVSHHRPPPGQLPMWQAPDPRASCTMIEALLPHLSADLDRLLADLPDLPPVGGGPVHGDFSADQVIIGPTGATLVDWDRAALGPAARDLGSALAALDLDAIRGAATGDAAEALLDGYASVCALPDRAEIAAHRRHALLALVVDGFRGRRRAWDDEAASLLALALGDGLPPPRPARRIASLERALDAAAMQPALAAAMRSAPPEGQITASLTRLKPGRRAMVRYRLADGRVLLGKLSAKGADPHTPRFQERLRKAGLDGATGIGVPAVVAALDDPPIWLQDAVPGQPLGTALEETSDASRQAMHRTGQALAGLHATRPQTERRWTHEDELQVLKRAVADGPYSDLYRRSAALLRGLPKAEEVGLHRDFYFDQVLVAPEAIWLVDLDLYARGDPAIDIGNFLAHLTELALRAGKPATFYAWLEQAFLDGYAGRRALPPAASIDALHTISLARHVAIAQRFPERRPAIPAIANLCRAALPAGPKATQDHQ